MKSCTIEAAVEAVNSELKKLGKFSDKYLTVDKNFKSINTMLDVIDKSKLSKSVNVTKKTEVKVDSNQTGLEYALTNPTHTSPRGYKWEKGDKATRKYLEAGIDYNGEHFADVEQAYQKYSTKGRGVPQDDKADYALMVDLIEIKLNTFPRLVKGINDKGGIGYLESIVHQPTSAKSRWHTNGDNLFQKALIEAYGRVTGSNKTAETSNVNKVPSIGDTFVLDGEKTTLDDIVKEKGPFLDDTEENRGDKRWSYEFSNGDSFDVYEGENFYEELAKVYKVGTTSSTDEVKNSEVKHDGSSELTRDGDTYYLNIVKDVPKEYMLVVDKNSDLGSRKDKGKQVILIKALNAGIHSEKDVTDMLDLVKKYTTPGKDIIDTLAKVLKGRLETNTATKTKAEWIAFGKQHIANTEVLQNMLDVYMTNRGLEILPLNRMEVAYDFSVAAYQVSDSANDESLKATDGAKSSNEANNKTVIKDLKYELFPGVYANEGQRNAIDVLSEFLNGDGTEYVLKGRGGTGKTTIVNKVLSNASMRYNDVYFTTISHKAKQVIEMANKDTPYASSEYAVTESSLYKQRTRNGETTNKIIKKAPSVIVVDEASMLSKSVIQDLRKTADAIGAKILYMGDNVQLPPVGEKPGAPSPIFDAKAHPNVVELTERMRQGTESPILPITDVLAGFVEGSNGIVLDGVDKKNKNGSVEYLNSGDSVTSKYVEDFKKDPTSTRYVWYNNAVHKNTEKLVSTIREKLYGDKASEKYVEGEQIILNGNFHNVGGDFLGFNSAEYTVKDLRTRPNTVLMYTKWQNGKATTAIHKYNKPVYVITAVDNISKNTVELIAPVGPFNQATKDMPKAIKEELADVSYAYVISTHKAQGSTYKTVYTDVENILFAPGANSIDQAKSLYVATSRPTEKLVMLNADKVVYNKLGATDAGSELNEVYVDDKELAEIKAANDKFKEEYPGVIVDGDEFWYEDGVITVVKPNEHVDEAMYEVYTAHEIKHYLTAEWLSKHMDDARVKYLLDTIDMVKEFDPGRDYLSNLLQDRLKYVTSRGTKFEQVAELVAILSSEPNIRKTFIEQFPQTEQSSIEKLFESIMRYLASKGFGANRGKYTIGVVDSIIEQSYPDKTVKDTEFDGSVRHSIMDGDKEVAYVSMATNMEKDVAYINMVGSKVHKRGFADAALNYAIHKYGNKTIKLIVVPMEDDVEFERLQKWYESKGFIANGTVMERKPHILNKATSNSIEDIINKMIEECN